MKRGFLNSPKAQAKLATPAPSDRATQFLDLASQSQQAGGLKRAAVNMDGYKSETQMKEFDGNTNDYQDSHWIVSRQPATPNDASLAEFPDGWAECFITGRAKRAILSTPGFPEALPRADSARPIPYEIRESSGKGMGMFATRDIECGELIMAERPMLVIPAAYAPAVPVHFTPAQQQQAVLNEMEKILEQMVGRMPEEMQRAYKELSNCHQEDGSGPLFGIARTNGLSVSDYYEPAQPGLPDSARYYSATCKILSRINHSCCPNAHRDWDSPTFSYYLYSVRAIKKDEEITINYLGEAFDSTASRQRQVTSYGFQCSCKRCQNPARSDKRAKEIMEYARPQPPPVQTMMLVPGMMPSIGGNEDVKKKTIDPSLKGLKMMDEDGLQNSWRYGELLKRLSEAYTTMGPGYEEEVKKWKELHKKHWTVHMGARNIDTKEEHEKQKNGEVPQNAIEAIMKMMQGMNMGGRAS
ncbi:hypothetical protein VKT23_008776 [Stygiomarasmius scandens]|uniref:SET domain-containing protein n=1 Tax=Marasmiellus scandens TaxID=2682957 RepID=A0ABR1JHX6_9AGAR